MLEKNVFLKKYNIPKSTFNSTGLEWSNLVSIFQDYEDFKTELEHSAIYISNLLMKSDKVHSLRYRIKDSEHLVEKIIRKKLLTPTSDINIDNYRELVKDLIGVRALHLYKEDWKFINDFIKEKWQMSEKPVANYRRGDSLAIVDDYKANGCEVKEHQYGYRSVHYIIETSPNKIKHYAEIQVRTIFEEAWAEIDHTIRYPYDIDNELYSKSLSVLNRLAGSADEMGSYIRFLKSFWHQKDLEFENQLEEKSLIIEELEEKLNKPVLNSEDINVAKQKLEELKTRTGAGAIPNFTSESIKQALAVVSLGLLEKQRIARELNLKNKAGNNSGETTH